MTIALARRYRPKRFADLLVQDHVAAVLRGAVARGRVGHGYLLTGPRGVGKTTAAGAGDAASVAAIYLPDARLMPPNAPTIQGRDAIQQFWGGFLGTYTLKIEVTAEEVEGRGDLAYARGRYVLDATPKVKGPAPFHEVGKFLEILRRQPDGSWRYVVDMYSPDAPAPK